MKGIEGMLAQGNRPPLARPFPHGWCWGEDLIQQDRRDGGTRAVTIPPESWARQALSITMEWTGLGRTGIAIFPSLPTVLDPAVQRVGEAI